MVMFNMYNCCRCIGFYRGLVLTKIVNIHTGEERTIQTFDCSICDDKFSENDTGLQRGIIGNTFVSLCPICLKGIINLVDYISNQTSIEE